MYRPDIKPKRLPVAEKPFVAENVHYGGLSNIRIQVSI